MEALQQSAQEWVSKHASAGIRVTGVGNGGLRLLLGDGDGHEVLLTSNPWAISTSDKQLEEEFFADNVNDSLQEVSSVQEALAAIAGVWREMQGEADDEGYTYERGEDDDDEGDYDAAEQEAKVEVGAASATNDDWEDMKRFGSAGRAGNANKRLMKDLAAIMRQDTKPLGFEIEQIDEDILNRWRVKLFGFEDCPLVEDLKTLEKTKNIGYIELEMVFERDYPFSPPFLRVIYPRFQFHTGHITIGGSICMELLTPSGWRPTNDIESVIIQIRAEMIAGGARIDFSQDFPYTEAEARAAFRRVANQHGWL